MSYVVCLCSFWAELMQVSTSSTECSSLAGAYSNEQVFVRQMQVRAEQSNIIEDAT